MAFGECQIKFKDKKLPTTCLVITLSDIKESLYWVIGLTYTLWQMRSMALWKCVCVYGHMAYWVWKAGQRESFDTMILLENLCFANCYKGILNFSKSPSFFFGKSPSFWEERETLSTRIRYMNSDYIFLI